MSYDSVRSMAEASRQAYLGDIDVTRANAEGRFDRIATVARRQFGTPVAFVGLVREDIVDFIGRSGLELDAVPRVGSFCSQTVLSDEVLVVPDARRDPRFASSPLVTGATGIRFYAGAPLMVAPGVRIGSLCIIDTQPREPLNSAQLLVLRNITDMAAQELRAMVGAAGDAG